MLEIISSSNIYTKPPSTHLQIVNTCGLVHQLLISPSFNLIGPTLSTKLKPLSHCRSVASLYLFYNYFNRICFNEFAALVSLNVNTLNQPESVKSEQFHCRCQKTLYCNSFFVFFPLQLLTFGILSLIPRFPDCINMQKIKWVFLHLLIHTSMVLFQQLT